MIERELPNISREDMSNFFQDIASLGDDLPKAASKLTVLANILQKHSLGLMNTAKSITSDSEIDVNKSIRNMMITMSYLCEFSYLLGLICNTYLTSKNFKGDLLELGMKCGAKPESALSWMLKQKMQGNW